jgi:hypothetical protein
MQVYNKSIECPKAYCGFVDVLWGRAHRIAHGRWYEVMTGSENQST